MLSDLDAPIRAGTTSFISIDPPQVCHLWLRGEFTVKKKKNGKNDVWMLKRRASF